MSLIAEMMSAAATPSGLGISLVSNAAKTGDAASVVTQNVTPQEDDLIVVVAYTTADMTSSSFSVSGDVSGAFTSGSSKVQAGTVAADSVFGEVFYQLAGASPDTSVSLAATTGTATADGSGVLVYIFRNADTSTPLDTTTTSATNASAGDVSAASITTVTPGAWVLQGVGIGDGSLTTTSFGLPQISGTTAVADTTVSYWVAATRTAGTDDLGAVGAVVFNSLPTATPSMVFRYDGSAQKSVAFSVAIRPANPGL